MPGRVPQRPQDLRDPTRKPSRPWKLSQLRLHGSHRAQTESSCGLAPMDTKPRASGGPQLAKGDEAAARPGRAGREPRELPAPRPKQGPSQARPSPEAPSSRQEPRGFPPPRPAAPRDPNPAASAPARPRLALTSAAPRKLRSSADPAVSGGPGSNHAGQRRPAFKGGGPASAGGGASPGGGEEPLRCPGCRWTFAAPPGHARSRQAASRASCSQGPRPRLLEERRGLPALPPPGVPEAELREGRGAGQGAGGRAGALSLQLDRVAAPPLTAEGPGAPAKGSALPASLPPLGQGRLSAARKLRPSAGPAAAGPPRAPSPAPPAPRLESGCFCPGGAARGAWGRGWRGPFEEDTGEGRLPTFSPRKSRLAVAHPTLPDAQARERRAKVALPGRREAAPDGLAWLLPLLSQSGAALARLSTAASGKRRRLGGGGARRWFINVSFIDINQISY